MTSKTIMALYDTYEDAVQAVRAIEEAGVPHSDISLIANNADHRHETTRKSNAAPDAEIGAAVGAAAGGGAGLLAGLGLLVIPGIGPVVAAGWLVATAIGAAAGAGAGAAAGGLIGSLTAAGVSNDHAQLGAESVRRGGSLVTARVDEKDAAGIEAIVRRYHPVDPDSRGTVFRGTGWTEFNETAEPYTPSDLERERAQQHHDGLRTL